MVAWYFKFKAMKLSHFLSWFLLSLLSLSVISACNNDDDDDPISTANNWDISAAVDLGGEFDVTADAKIDITGDNYTAEITTKQIGEGAEEHEITVTGSVQNGNTLLISDYTFQITVGETNETITLDGTVTISGDNVTGSGALLSVIDGVADPIPGTFTLTGTKKAE
jgi:hypothetical protein